MANLSIGTFNTLNFHVAGGLVYGDAMYSEAAFDRKAGWVGRQIQEMNADLIGFQEVWALDALVEATTRSGHFQPNQVFMLNPGPAPTEPNVALATTLPVQEVTFHPDFPAGMNFGEHATVSTFARPVLHAQVELRPGTVGHVLVAHLKSKRPTFLENEDTHDPRNIAIGYARSLLRRAAEATALRWMIIELTKDSQAPVVLIGDLNDGVEAVSTRILLGDPPFGGSAESVAKAYDILLYSTYELQAGRGLRDVFYTHQFGGSYETLDHILVSEELAGRGPKALAELKALEMLNDHLNNADKTRTDHGQVVARFRWR